MVLRAGFHGTVGQPSAQVIDGSLKFDSSATNYLKKTPTVAGNRRTFTISFWVKRSEGSANEPGIFSTYDGSNPAFTCYFNSSDQLRIYNYTITYTCELLTTQRFRDYDGWYHILLSADVSSPSSDASNRLKLYVNGVRVTDFATESYPSSELDWNAATAHNIGRHANAYDGNISNFYHIDGQTLGPEYFGFTDPLTNTWRPKKFEGPTSPNNGTTWSNSLSGTANNTIANPTNLFNNDITSYADRSSGSSDPMDYTFTPPSTIRANSSIRIYAFAANGHSDNHIKITYNNGVEATKTAADLGLGNPGNQVWFDLSSYINFPADISSIEYRSISGGGQFGAIEIDGILLIDGLNDPKGFGTNGFYLPFDGNSPIGQDKSSRGNDWTPQYNFGGSNTIEKATGALPILNTTNGGNTAAVGVRTDATVAAGVGTCALALPLFNSKEDVSNQIDSKSSQKSISINGDPTGTTSISNFYGGSYYFDATDDYLYTSSVYSDLNFKTGDFTIEAWCYASSSARAGLWQLSYTSGGLRPDDLQLSCHYENTKFNFGSAGGSRTNGKEYSTNRWHHVAEVRKDGVISTYINGVLDQSWTDTSTYWEGDTYVCVGGYWNTSYLWNGYIQDFRVYNGVAKYTSDFIPASTNPDILPDTPSGVSGGSKLTKITEGAVAFDGTNDYLTIPWSSDFDLGLDSDFTIEFFVNFQDDATTSTLLSWGSDINNRFDIGCQSANQLRLFAVSGGNTIINGFTPISTKKWHHVAVVGYSDYDGNGQSVLVFYLDGVREFQNFGALDTYAMPTDTSNGIEIGRRRYDTTNITDYFGGFISNLRIVKGSAVYPYQNNITVPTEPLTNVTNTTLLCCQDITNTDNTWNTRMFVSDSAHTDKAGVLANGTEVFGGESISGKYIFIVPNSNDPSSSSDFIWSGNGALTNSDSSNRWHMTKRVSGNWIHTSGSYGSDNYDEFYYGDDTDNYQLDKTHDFYGISAYGDGDGGPGQFSGTLPYLSRYLSTPVSPSSVKTHGGASLSNFNPFNTDINTVRGQETGYPTFNPLSSANSNANFSDGNLTINKTGTSHSLSYSNIGVSDGKWYWEVTKLTTTDDGGLGFGVHREDKVYPNNGFRTGDGIGQVYLQSDTIYYYDNTTTEPSMSSNSTFNDAQGTFMLAYDVKAGKLYFGKDGQWLNGNSGLTGGNPSVGTGALLTALYPAIAEGKTFYPYVSPYNSGQNMSINFGQKPFKFPPPDGFQTINAANVRPETVIVRPDQYVGVTTYAGTALTQSIDHFNFKPDLAWIKVTDNQRSNFLFDSVRGAENYIISNTNGLQVNDSTYLTSFNSNGFTVGTSPDVNRDTSEIVAWCWKAGGGPGITSTSFWKDDKEYASSSAMGLTNGAATIRSASVGTKQGFSIVAYNSTGSSLTLDHGLSQKPDFFIFKCTSHDQHWAVGHSYDYTKELYLGVDGSLQAGSSTTSWGSGPDNNVFTLGTSDYVNTANREYVCYSWHNVPGLQKFGSFTGNGDADGPFIELGFRPAIIWVKRTTTNGYNWVVQDSERQKHNPVGEYLLLNSDNQFGSGFDVDFLSNGFKLRNANGNMNGTSTPNYLYCAWAEAPSVNLYGGTSNAR